MNTTSVAFVNSRITLTNTCYRRLGATSDMVCLTVKNKLFQLGLSLGWDWDPRPFIYKTHISRNVVCPQPLLFPTSSRSLPHQSRDHYYPTHCHHTPTLFLSRPVYPFMTLTSSVWQQPRHSFAFCEWWMRTWMSMRPPINIANFHASNKHRKL